MSARMPARSARAAAKAISVSASKRASGIIVGVGLLWLRILHAPATHALPLPYLDRGPVLPSSLTVSIVTFRSDVELLERCLHTLAAALDKARAKKVVRSV